MADENGTQESAGLILFGWSTAVCTPQQREGDPPAVGATVENGETMLQVTKLGPSPLPGDRRRCAYTQLA